MIFDDDDDGLGLPSLLFTSDDSEAARELAKMLALKANMAPSGGCWDGLIYMCMGGWTEEDRRDESLGKGGVLLVGLVVVGESNQRWRWRARVERRRRDVEEECGSTIDERRLEVW